MPAVSVIVPVYNAEAYLACCLESLQTQTLKDLEFICVNDGSTDGSLKILETYAAKDPRFKLINRPGTGVSAARNAAFKTALGKYIGYVDSDDWVPADYFEKLFDAAEYHQAEIAGAGIEYILPKGHKSLLKVKKYKVSEKMPEKYKMFNIPHFNFIWNKIYRRDFMQRAELSFPEGRVYEDILFTHKALNVCNKAVSVPGVVYFYRHNPDSITHILTPQKQQQLHQAVAEAREYVLKEGIKVDFSQYPKREKHPIRCFGCRVGKVVVWDYITKYYLFGIKVFQKKSMLDNFNEQT